MQKGQRISISHRVLRRSHYRLERNTQIGCYEYITPQLIAFLFVPVLIRRHSTFFFSHNKECEKPQTFWGKSPIILKTLAVTQTRRNLPFRTFRFRGVTSRMRWNAPIAGFVKIASAVALSLQRARTCSTGHHFSPQPRSLSSSLRPP